MGSERASLKKSLAVASAESHERGLRSNDLNCDSAASCFHFLFLTESSIPEEATPGAKTPNVPAKHLYARIVAS